MPRLDEERWNPGFLTARAGIAVRWALILAVAGLGAGCGDPTGEDSAEGAAVIEQGRIPVPGYEDQPEEVQQARREFELSLQAGIDKKIRLLKLLREKYDDLPFEDEILSALASSLNIRGRVDETAELYRTLLEKHPDSVYALDAQVYLREVARTRDDEMALRDAGTDLIALVDRLAEKEPDRLHGDLGFLKAESLIDVERLPEAEKLLLEIREANPGEEGRLVRSKALVYLMQVHGEKGDYEAALRTARTLLDVQEEKDASSNLRVVRPESKEFDDRIAELVISWALGGADEIEALRRLDGKIKVLDMIRTEKAKERARKALEGNPEQPSD